MVLVVAEKKAKPDWQAAAERGDFEEAILALIRRRDWLSFCELDRLLTPFCPDDPTAAIYAGDCVLWDALPEPVACAVVELLKQKAVYLWPVTFFVYVADGRIPPYPVAASPAGGRGGKTKWWPACLRLVGPVRPSLTRLWKEIDVA